MRGLSRHELKKHGYGLTADNTAHRDKPPYTLKRCYACGKFHEPHKVKERYNPCTGRWGLMCFRCKLKKLGRRPEKRDNWRYYVKKP